MTSQANNAFGKANMYLKNVTGPHNEYVEFVGKVLSTGNTNKRKRAILYSILFSRFIEFNFCFILCMAFFVPAA